MTVAKPPHPLISSHPSTSGLKISLHPLALLTISDYVSRHTLRNMKGPIVGALLGSQNGREISIEHAYELKLIDVPVEDGKMETDGEENVRVDEAWFVQKLKQFKDVHPTLDFIGHFTYLPAPPNHLPRQFHLNIQTQLLSHNESLIFLALHPSPLSTSAGGKLPLTIYETVYEEEGDTQENKVLKMKFTELSYTIETGEAEMIGVDHVAKGGLNAGDETGGSAAAAAAAKDEKASSGAGGKDEKKDTKGKGKAAAESASAAAAKEEKEVTFESIALPTQTQELLSTLTAKANAVRMLHSRLTLLLAYLRSIESGNSTTAGKTDSQQPQIPKINHPLLRSLLSLTNRLPLLEPPATAASSLSSESLAELSDVHLVALLGAITSSIEISKEVGRKFAAVEASRGGRDRGQGMGGGGGPPGSMMEFGGYDSTGDDNFGAGAGGRAGLMGTLGGLLRNGGVSGRMGGRRF
ncbi:hypothetical protein H072_7829 [Dactylellina haptotyla CBS 200.50]|uniref:COP9 signalosome complex subunit 6 n=1 Tax=Dactylellina haptotyla (strain CBS 200.50) TaxID=1284197 RepID=S8BGL5_DACHA|nr:hypothetical protein H072_7829 [Dactylellina haptotyla CBS 200.50]